MIGNLAIKGHVTRGKEVIEILEMMGGVNSDGAYGNLPNGWNVGYYIFDGVIKVSEVEILTKKKFKIYTLEEFLNKFPYKVGDKVNISSYKNIHIDNMKWNNNEMLYEVFINETEWYSADELNIFNNPQKEENVEDKGTLVEIDLTKELKKSDEIEVILGDYEFVLKNGKTYFVKKKPQYPKTYKECCEILNYIPNSYDADEILVYGYMSDELRNLQKLLVCLHAYWKIAGEQMGLNEPWEFKIGNNSKEVVYAISVFGACIMLDFYHSLNCNKLLVFPTEEMRDAFHENFRKLIEQCKKFI